MRGSRSVGACLAALALTGCVFGGDETSKSSSGQIGDRDLAVPAQSIPAEETTTTSVASSTGAASSASSSTTSHGPRRIVTITDASGDTGDGAGYADAVEVTIDDDGTTARIRVRMRSTVPLTLSDREVMGVGVNINDAQVFADGESDGWYAYLQLGDHFLTYPGTFDLADDTLIFTLPWSVLGDPNTGSVDAFVDWSKPLGGPQTQSSADRMPDTGSANFAR